MAETVSCFEARPLVSVMLDGEADDFQRARVDRHLRSCPRCREFLRFSDRARAVAQESALGVQSARPSQDHARIAARLAVEVSDSRAEHRQSDSWRSVVVGGTLVAALSLGVVLGGLGVWTLTQETSEQIVSATPDLSLPRVVASRTLDSGPPTQEPASILTAWAPPRAVENTFDEKAMFWATPMSHFERVHFRPERL